MDEFITTKEAAQITKFKAQTIRRLARNGKIPCSKPNGRNVYFRRSDIEKWMMSGNNQQEGKA